MSQWRKNLYPLSLSFLFLVVISLPFLFAVSTSNNEYIFSGFLNNPLDGNSYLAKMYQGWRGDLRFRLPYTSESGDGGYINMFYLIAGHFTRFFHLPLLGVFHLFRIMGASFLAWSLWAFYGKTLPDDGTKKLAFSISLFGSGMGWILLTTDVFTADFWVSEAFPFLSSYTNSHFPLGLALILYLIVPGSCSNWKPYLAFIPAFILGIVSPFGITITLVVLGGTSLISITQAISQQQINSISEAWSFVDRRILWILLGGGPILVYDYWIIFSDPILSGWNTQNLTSSPPLWDLVISTSPCFILAVVGCWQLIRNRRRTNSSTLNVLCDEPGNTLLVWIVVGIGLVYFPFSLQRRFMMGLFIPIAGLAAYGFDQVIGKSQRSRQLWLTLLIVFSVTTNVVVVLAGIGASASRDSKIFLTMGEDQAFTWIESKTPLDALILASPEIGLWIPAHTGRRVIYGHPFETVNAEAEENAVLSFFTGELDITEQKEFLSSRGIDYVFYGLREQALGTPAVIGSLELVFDSAGVSLYEVHP